MRPSDFHVGDKVEHMSGATGTITELLPDAVRVDLQNTLRGKLMNWTAEYDEAWFRKYPTGLKQI